MKQISIGFRMVRIALTLLSLSFFQAAQAGVVVTIPTIPGTDTTNLTPTNRRAAFSAARMIYTASEVGMTGTITHLAFEKDTGSTSVSVNYISIFMRETTASTLTTAVPTGFPTGYTRVYNSSFIDNTMSSGWTTITLSTAVGEIFTYSGGSNNLDIVVVKTNSETAVTGYPNYPVYNCHTATGPVSAYYFSNSSALGTTFTATTTKRPNIRLTIENTCAGKPAKGSISGPSTAVCSGANFTLTGTGLTLGTGMKYQWQSRLAGTGAFVNTSASDTLGSLTTNTMVDRDYRIYSVCMLSGQSDTANFITINALNPSTISALSDTTFCSGGSVTLNATTVPGATYTWFKDAVSTGITGNSFVANASGVYTVRASTAACSGIMSNTKTVTVQPLPPVTVTPLSATTFCDGLSVVLQGPTGSGLSYQWQRGGVDIFGATSSSYTATTSGNYRVKVTNTSTSCFDFSTVTAVTVNPMPMKPAVSGAAGRTSICTGESLLLSTIPTSGVSYQWNNLSGAISGATSSSYNATAGNTYTLTAILGSCTRNSDPFVLTENPLPAASIAPSGTISFCNGDSVRVDAAAVSGMTYEWQESSIATGESTSSIFVKTTGVYRVKITNASTGCSDVSPTLTVNIIAPVLPTIAAAGPTSFCEGTSVTLNATVGTGLLMQWQLDNADIPGALSSSYVAATSGQYRMKVTNGVGCAAYSTPIDVVVHKLPDNSTTITGGTDICNGESSVILAAVKPKYTYQWRNAGIDIPGETSNPFYAKTAGTYSARITDSNGCQSTTADIAVTVKFVSPFFVTPHGNTFFCDGEETKLSTKSGFVSYQWFRDGIFIPGATDTFVHANKTGKYTVTVQDPLNGCYASSTGFNIIVIPAPDTPFITKTGSRLSTSVTGVLYQWYKDAVLIPGATNSYYDISAEEGVYAVVVTNDRDCSKRAEIDLNATNINQALAQTHYIKLYPNPTRSLVHIEAPEFLTVSLFDVQGRLLTKQANPQVIDLSSYATGMYLVQFTTADGTVVATEKISKVE